MYGGAQRGTERAQTLTQTQRASTEMYMNREEGTNWGLTTVCTYLYLVAEAPQQTQSQHAEEDLE